MLVMPVNLKKEQKDGGIEVHAFTKNQVFKILFMWYLSTISKY